MKTCDPSTEWVARLSGCGCPLDRAIKMRLEARKLCPIRVSALAAQDECRVFDLSAQGGTGYAIGVRIESLQSKGIVVTDWSFVPPWSDHFITWGLDPRQLLGQRNFSLMDDPNDLMVWQVLEERRRVPLARPVEGWLFGQSVDSIPADVATGDRVTAQLSVTEESGAVAASKIHMQVDRSVKLKNVEQKQGRKTDGGEGGIRTHG